MSIKEQSKEPFVGQMQLVEKELLYHEGDEIPGYTDFIYRLNRYRRPEEYVGYWKEREKLEVNLAKSMKALDLDPTWNQEDILNILINLNKKVEDLEKREDDWRKDIQDAHEVKYELTTKLDLINQKIKTSEDQFTKESAARKKALMLVMQYGGHENNCSYIEVASCGRVMAKEEEKLCDCGWAQVVKEIKDSNKGTTT